MSNENNSYEVTITSYSDLGSDLTLRIKKAIAAYLFNEGIRSEYFSSSVLLENTILSVRVEPRFNRAEILIHNRDTYPQCRANIHIPSAEKNKIDYVMERLRRIIDDCITIEEL